MSDNQPKTKHYRVQAIRQVEVYQWVIAESREEAIRVAKEGGGAWEEDHFHDPDDFEVTDGYIKAEEDTR